MMKIFTFTSEKLNYSDGEYDFVAEQWLDALEMATKFEMNANKEIANNDNYTIKFNLNMNSVKIVSVKPGFINIRRRIQPGFVGIRKKACKL